MSWLLRGAQSAVFYYASCTPFHQWKHQRRRKQQNHADRAAREAYEKEIRAQDPYGTAAHNPEMLYRQPSPQATNQFWTDEILMGPGPPPKRAKKRKPLRDATESRKNLERELSPGPTARPPDIVVEEHTGEPTATDGAAERDTVASIDGPKSATTDSPRQLPQDDAARQNNLSRKSSIRASAEDAKWNHRRFYQREDEALWGIELSSSVNPTVSDVNLQRSRSSTNKDMARPISSKSRPHAPSTASTASIMTTRSQLSAHLNVRAVAQATASTDSFYAAPRAPPVNDYHPPIANNPLHSKKVLTKWMLQPTPAPSVMSGKKQVRRSTVSSTDSAPPSRGGGGSLKGSLRRERGERHITTADGDPSSMRRKLSARLLAAKMRNGSYDSQLAADPDADGNDADVEEEED